MRPLAAVLAMLTGGCALFLDGGGDGDGDGDGDAIGIELSQGDLDPPFAPDDFEYTAQLPFLVSQITVTATGPGEITVAGFRARSGEDSHSLAVPLADEEPRIIDVSIDGAIYSVTISRSGLGDPMILMPDEVAADFGFSVAVEDDRVAVGARGSVAEPGQVCVVDSGGENCVDSGLATADGFGRSVAIDDDTLIVGAPLVDLAYVFVDSGDGWDRQDPALDGSGGVCGAKVTDGSGFGNAIAVDGDRAVVAANLENGNRGAVYVYQRTGDVWSCVQRIIRSGASTDDELGQSIDLDGDRLVIGANGVGGTGAAWVYTDDGGQFANPVEVVPMSGAAPGSRYGFRVDLHRDLLAVSAPTDNDVTDDGFGVVYLFERDDNDDWTEITSIDQNDASITEASELGLDIALDSGTLAIGAPSPVVADPGVVFVFAATDDTQDMWDLLTTIENGDVNDKLGHSLALDEGVLAIGAPGAAPLGQVSVLR